MSTLKVDAIRHNSATSDAITMASDGTCTAKVTSINGGSALSHRNIIINGDMTIHQRGGTIAFSEAGYSLDRWKMRTGNHSGAANITQETTSPDGFQKSLKVQVTTADNSLTGGEYFFVTQYVEANNIHHAAYGNSSAKTMTLSFYVRSNVTGTYNCAFYAPSSAKLFSKSYTISAQDTWERKTITIPGDTSGGLGTGTGTGMRVEWYLAAGTSYTSGSNQATWSSYSVGDTAPNNVNLLHSVSNNFYLTGVQLEIGDTATSYEHRSYADELRHCRRYFCKYVDNLNINFVNEHATNYSGYIHFPFYETMRAAPTITMGSNVSIGRPQVSVSQKVQTADSITPNCFNIIRWNGQGQLGSHGDAYYRMIISGSDSNSYIDCNAEL